MPSRVWTIDVAPEWLTFSGSEPAASDAQLIDAPDAALVDACLSGRRDAFDIIVERHQQQVYRLCYRFVGNHEDASDLAQDAFIRAYRGLRHFKGRSSLRTWLYRIGVNVCLNRVGTKAPKPEQLSDEHSLASRDESPAEAVLAGERAARVRAAIARLPKKQRATLILRVYHELQHEEIAAILGNSVGAVKANFFHALNNLRKLLREP